MNLSRTMDQQGSSPATPLWVLLFLLALSLPTHAALTASDSLVNMTVLPPSQANPFNFYQELSTRDASIFAGGTSAASSDGTLFTNLNGAYGRRTLHPIPGAPTAVNTTDQPNLPNTAFRADALSEVLATMALLYLEARGELPFSRSASIPSSFLPSTFTSATFLSNPSFPTVPITLNMLLQHISSVSEDGFSLGAATAPNGVAPSLSAFVGSLFGNASLSIFTSSQPGLSTSFNYSRTNTALVSYIVERVLAQSTNFSTFSSIGEFVFAVVLPPLQMSGTFLLNRNGTLIDTNYPLPSNNTIDRLGFVAQQFLTSDGSAVQGSYAIHASYFSDLMLFTTVEDLTQLARGLFMPTGIYYATIGSLMLQNAVPISLSATLYAQARTTGLFLFNTTNLCSTMYAVIGFSGQAPYCSYSSATVSAAAPSFGFVSTGGENEVAVVCMPVVSSGETFCTVAELSFFEAGARSGNAVITGNRAVGLAMVPMSYLTSEPMPTPAPANEAGNSSVNGWYVFAGVMAAIVVVIVAAYVTDYFIKPPPPAKIVGPVLSGQIGLRPGVAMSNRAAGDFSGVAGDPALGGSSAALRGSSSSSSSQGSSPLAPGTTTTPPLGRRGGVEALTGAAGGSSLRRRRRRPHNQSTRGAHRDGGSSSDDASRNPTGDEGAAREEDLGGSERSYNGAPQHHLDGKLHFDAYI